MWPVWVGWISAFTGPSWEYNVSFWGLKSIASTSTVLPTRVRITWHILDTPRDKPLQTIIMEQSPNPTLQKRPTPEHTRHAKPWPDSPPPLTRTTSVDALHVGAPTNRQKAIVSRCLSHIMSLRDQCVHLPVTRPGHLKLPQSPQNRRSSTDPLPGMHLTLGIDSRASWMPFTSHDASDSASIP